MLANIQVFAKKKKGLVSLSNSFITGTKSRPDSIKMCSFI